MSSTSQWPLPGALGALVVTLSILGCPLTTPPIPVRPECPTETIVVPAGDTGWRTTGQLAGPGALSLIPEYHDCQRFVNASHTTFGPLIAVFATRGLESVDDPGPPGPPTTVTFEGADKAAATILNYHEPYEPLRIEHGFNCLYMVAVNGVWQAHIVAVKSDSACIRPMAENPGGADLRVSVLRGPSADSVPPVARWDYDPVVGKHYIGIRCGRRWCEVFDPSQQAVNTSPQYAGSIQAAVKGWYDEQYLALKPLNPGGPLVPGGALATIVPVPNLATFRLEDFDSTWQKVAMVSLSEPSPKYLEKFNFVRSPPPFGQSEVSLCRGDMTACGIPASAAPAACDNTNDPWWAKIETGEAKRFRCVIRRTHPGIEIPGVVRWRWQEEDEDMWIRCPAGCCQVT